MDPLKVTAIAPALMLYVVDDHCDQVLANKLDIDMYGLCVICQQERVNDG